ncbi:hypothetical protein Turpa_3156 [Turneriella parva DSM 21527]|uniref:Lipoprotein n=2 Tax=Turneriella TaxID=338321 RepID=I4B938_TURPD|nr:hypothetical protein Turpa_3156 [Turneriella parva DSM 21527]
MQVGARAFSLFFVSALLAAFVQPVHSEGGAGALELEILRGVAVSPAATMRDLCDIVLIQRGELEKYPQAASRCEAVAAQKIYEFSKGDIPLIMPVTAGAASKAAINAHGLEKSFMFALTGLEWYAVQSAEHLGLVKARTAHYKKLSGEELLAIFEIAFDQAEAKSKWQKPVNPYEPFGGNSYEEINKAYEKMTETGKEPTKNKK